MTVVACGEGGTPGVCEVFDSQSSDGRAVGGLKGLWDGSTGHRLVGHWRGHGGLAGTLTEQAPVGRPVFALDGGREGGGVAAEGQGQGAARTRAQSPAQHPMALIGAQEGGHRVGTRARVVPLADRPRDAAAAAVAPYSSGGGGAADAQSRDLDRLAAELLVGHVLVHKTVHTPVHLLQVHLLVLEGARERKVGEGGRGWGRGGRG